MTIVACPKCADSVVLPLRASQRATVRCPLCQAEFPLAAVLDKMPPELIVVDDPDAVAAMPSTGATAAASGAIPLFVEPESNSGGFAPLSIETAAPGAPATTAARRRRPAAAAKRKPKNPVAEGVKIVLGGVAGLVIAQVILWWIGSAKEWPSKRADISGLAPKIARFAPWVVPERYRGRKPSSEAVSESGTIAAAAPKTASGAPPGELPQRTFVTPNESAATPDGVKSSGGRAKRSGKSQKTGGVELLAPDAREADPFGVAPAPAKPKHDLTALPEVETDPLADMELDTEMPLDDKPVADPVVVGPEEEAKGKPDEAPKSVVEPLPNAPQTTAAELASAAEDAETVVRAWRSGSDADSRELIRQSYVALAKLGETLAFRKEPAGAELQTAVELVQSLKADDAKLNTLGRVAGGWLKATGRDSHGVLLVGTVKQVRQQGGYEVIDLTISGGEQSVAVYRKLEPSQAYSPDSRLLVLGAIVDDPGKNLAGYEGDAAFVIWQGLLEELPSP